MSEPVIAITLGDPAGIGPEVIIKAHHELLKTGAAINALVVGDLEHLRAVSESLGLQTDLLAIDESDAPRVPHILYERKGALPVIDLENVERDALEFGKPDMFTGKASIDYISAALQLAKSGSVSALATAPVSKKAINEAGFAFSGHTELIARALGATDYAMMFVCPSLRVFLLTTHIPLSKVPSQVTRQNVRRLIFLADRTLARFFGIEKPKIAACGLNPHAGEEGVIGPEEEREIMPAITDARSDGIEVEGPMPADTVFTPANAARFDAVITMYHDQGLIPVKMADFAHAVNVTVGLPLVRVSVSHGTAND
ncbi:MAG: 4-hydroxythreonine-4-phosphate dehydrogenase PdxA, partial [Candidatus Coatesbacteria bacterium]|nr:4-hydroxythreonine-4-phosphate dehydrogenase PdxA [Candidatus Coatesbacteria bacterium]